MARLAGKALLGQWQEGSRRYLNKMMAYRGSRTDGMVHVMLAARSLEGAHYYARKSNSPYTPFFMLQTATKLDEQVANHRLTAENALQNSKGNTGFAHSVLAYSYASSGKVTSAVDIIEKIKTLKYKDPVFSALAIDSARKRNFAEAINYIDTISHEINKSDALLELAIEQAQQDKIVPSQHLKKVSTEQSPFSQTLSLLGTAMGIYGKNYSLAVRPETFSSLGIVWGKYDKNKKGLKIRSTEPGGPSSDLSKRALIVDISGVEVKSPADALALVLPMKVGTKVTLTPKCKKCPSTMTLVTASLSVATAGEDAALLKTAGNQNLSNPPDAVEASFEKANAIVESKIFSAILGETPQQYHWWACNSAIAASNYQLFKKWLTKNEKKYKKWGYEGKRPEPSTLLWQEFRVVAQYRPDVFLWSDERARIGTVGRKLKNKRLLDKNEVEPIFKELLKDNCH